MSACFPLGAWELLSLGTNIGGWLTELAWRMHFSGSTSKGSTYLMGAHHICTSLVLFMDMEYGDVFFSLLMDADDMRRPILK